MDGTTDVVVTDGYTGNMVLKILKVQQSQLARC